MTPRNLIMTSQPHTHGFRAANNRHALARSMAAAFSFLIEPCGVDETRGAVMHVHQLVVNYPNKRVLSPDKIFQMFERYAPGPAVADCLMTLRPIFSLTGRHVFRCHNILTILGLNLLTQLLTCPFKPMAGCICKTFA